MTLAFKVTYYHYSSTDQDPEHLFFSLERRIEETGIFGENFSAHTKRQKKGNTLKQYYLKDRVNNKRKLDGEQTIFH